MTISKPLPQDAATTKQKGFIVSLLYHASPNVTAHTREDEWLPELNALCNTNIASLDELTKREASNIITQLQTL
jgi:hypothetical protein